MRQRIVLNLDMTMAEIIHCHAPTHERFWAKVLRTDCSDDCWLWTAATGSGYGTFVMTNQGKSEYWRAHRVAWIIANGPVPDDLEVCHNCPTGDNPLCVNPGHLFLATHQQNMADREQKGRGYSHFKSPNFLPKRGEENHNAKITRQEVVEIRAKRDEGKTYAQLAHEFPLCENTIRLICIRKSWSHVT